MPSPLPSFLTFSLPPSALSFLLCYISFSAVTFPLSLAPAASAPCFSGFLLSSSSSPVQQGHEHHFRRLWDGRWPSWEPLWDVRMWEWLWAVRILPKLKALCKWAALAKSYPKDSCRNKKGTWDAWEKPLPSNPPFHNVRRPTTCAQISHTPLLLYSAQKYCQGLFGVESLHMGIKHEDKFSVAICEVLCCC